MKKSAVWVAASALAWMGMVCVAGAQQAQQQQTAATQQTQKADYMNPGLPPQERAADLVKRMTLEEKATQLVNQVRAIPRLGVPAYDWWSEALHGDACRSIRSLGRTGGRRRI